MKTKKIISMLLTLVMMLSVMPLNIVFAEDNVASITADGTTIGYETFDAALAAAKAGDKIDIIKNTTYVGSIDKKIDINIKDSVTFTYTYTMGTETTNPENSSNTIYKNLFCDADITVENGGTIAFKKQGLSMTDEYLVVNGDFTLNSGATAKLLSSISGANSDGVVFNGKFTNNGTFDCIGDNNPNGRVFIKYGENPGNFSRGFPVYNLCIKTPSDATINDKEIKITEIKGDVEYNGVLSAEIDGFGNSVDLPDKLDNKVYWDCSPNGGKNGRTYKIADTDMGNSIGVKLTTISEPTKNCPYDYVAYKDGVVTKVHNGESECKVKTSPVPSLDKIYLGGTNASDDNSGKSADKALASYTTAVNLVNAEGTIIVCGEATIPNNWNFITKNITFTNKDGDTEYDAILTGGTQDETNLIHIAGSKVEFTGIKFKNSVIFGANPSSAVLNLNNVSTMEDSVITQYAEVTQGWFDVCNVNIKDSSDLRFDIQSNEDGINNKLSLDNSSIISDSEGSIGNVNLKNNSKIKTSQPIQTLTSDNSDNKIELIADDEKNIVPIVIEGDVTIAENKPITVMFDGTLPFNTKIFSSTAENTSLTADKFKSSQTGTTLKKENNDIFTAAEVYSITYVLDDGTLGENSPTTHTYGTETTLVTPTKSGYNFDGWYLEDTFDNKVETLTAEGYTDNITLYAKWNKRSSGGGTTCYTVKFNTNGGNIVTSQTIKKNGTATEPKKPTKDGYVFDGWYTDNKFTTEYDFDTKVTKNITLYAKWVEDEVQEPGDDKKDDNKPTPDEWKNPFDDVKENEWYFDDVKYANENGLMTGITDNTFAPNDNITRGMFVTVLYRLEGELAVNKSIPFADVKADMYYANAVIWAEQNDIVKGYSETEFVPDDFITREQIATILYRYAKFKGYDVTQGGMQIREYEDFESISNYAINAMTWAVNTGLMKGKTNTTLNPKDNATRAEIAAILSRFIENNK